MNASEKLSKEAGERARQMLAERLKRGGISTSRPEWYFECEPQRPQQYRGGSQVRVHTWRHWSDADVHYDADTGELMHRCVDRLADPPTDAELTKEEALRLAAGLITIPPDAELHSFGHEEFAEGRKAARLDWIHVHQGMRVDGDYLWVVIHPETHRLIAFGRKWRTVQSK